MIVVGAGPAGSVTALLLARRGHRVLIVDRARFPRAKPCGGYLNPDAVASLDRLDIGPRIRAAGATLSGIRIADREGRAVWAPFPEGRGLLVSRMHLDHMLLQEAACAGAEIIEEFRVDGIDGGTAPSVSGRHRGRPMRRAGRLVIAADGLHSVLARRAGGPRLAPEGHYTVGAHFEIPAAGAPRLDLHLGPGWYAGAAFHGDGTANIIVAVPRMIFRKAGGSVPALFAAACEQLPLLHASLDGARRSTPFISTGPLGCTRRAAVDDGLLFVGDAAGTINPMTGEGIATALRGAELAAATAERALRRGEASHKALAPYERARAEAFRDRWLVNRLLEKVIRRPVLTSFLLARLAEDPGLATTLLGVVGDVRPARDLISPGFLARLALFGA